MIPFLIALVPQTPGADPRFAVPTAIEITMEPVAPTLAGLGKGMGCSLEVATALKNRKVAVHTEKETLGQTLDRLAETMDAKWTPISGGWRLDAIPERLNELASYQKARRDVIVKESRLDLERKARLAKSTTFEKMKARREVLEDRLEKATRQAEKTEIAKELANPNLLQLDDYAVGTLYGGLTQDERKRFWNGEVFYATTAALLGGRALPEGADQWSDDRFTDDPDDARPNDDLRVFIRFHPVFGQVLHRTMRSFSSSRSLPRVSPPDSDELKRHPFREREDRWAQTNPFSSRRGEKVKELPDAGNGPWFAGYWSVAQALARLHAQTGLPIVAMVSRQPWPFAHLDSTPPGKRASLDGVLWSFAQNGLMALHESDGYLLAKPRDWAERLEYEPLEADLRAFEAIPRPTLDDYACLAAQLTEMQAYLLGRSEEMVSAHPFFVFSDGYSMLRLWGALSSRQRNAIRNGDSVPYASLAGVQRSSFEQAVLNAILEGAQLGESGKVAFDGPWDGSLFRHMALWGQTEGIKTPGYVYRSPLAPDRYLLSDSNGKRSGIRFTIGRQPGDGLLYTLEDPPR